MNNKAETEAFSMQLSGIKLLVQICSSQILQVPSVHSEKEKQFTKQSGLNVGIPKATHSQGSLIFIQMEIRSNKIRSSRIYI